MSSGDDHDLDALRAVAERIAREAGSLVASRLRTKRTVSTKSTHVDLVTEVDRASEELIAALFAELRPDDAIEGEEGLSKPGATGVLWLVDPLDGTTNYVYGYPAYAVSVGAEVGGGFVAGAVYDAARGEIFSAAEGRGATLDGEPIRVSGARDLTTSLVATGFGYEASRRAEQARVLLRVLPAVRDIRRGGAASLDLCHVACGRLDGYYERGLQGWDLAAGDVIVREAGGLTGAIEGGPPRPGSVLAASPAIFEPLRALLAP